MKTNKIFHVISNTHWDREWRFSFQRNRQMLVEMMDKLLEILQKEPKYRAFHLDSQSVVLDDYLQIRPEKRDLLRTFVEQKRLFIGPWYILPDQFLVGGENLIRNLLLGHKTCKTLGGASKIGYSPFSWGQISQLPQIYREFGINLIMFYRGVNSLDSKKSEFLWEGADGTRSLASRFSTMPRYNFYFYIYRPVVHNEGFYDIEYKWGKGGLPFHFADTRMYREDYFIPRPDDGYYKENIQAQVEKIIQDQADDFTTPHVIWMEGHDSSGPNVKTVRIVEDIKEIMGIPVIHGTLEEYAKALQESAKTEELALVKGERRSAQYDRRSGNLYGYVTSTRMYLKQKNFEAERWLQFYAEPFHSIAGILGMDIQDRYLEIAWNNVIQNSAHDSIGGCSLDEVHEDMMNRYKQAIEICQGVFSHDCQFLATRITTPDLPDPTGRKKDVEQTDQKKEADSSPKEASLPPGDSLFLVCVNPTGYDRRNEVVEAFLDIPKVLDKYGFALLDKDGNECKSQIVSSQDVQPVLEQMIDRPMYFQMKRYHAYLEVSQVPALGYATFVVRPNSSSEKQEHEKIARNEKCLENEFLKIKIHGNGTFSVLDKQNHREYEKMAYFYDEGEEGHAWVHKPVAPFLTTMRSKPEISLIQAGTLCATVAIRHTMKIPTNRLKKPNSPDQKVPTTLLPIEMLVTLRKGSRKVEIEIKVNNQAENHRLRVLFPLPIHAKCHDAEGQFDVVRRSSERQDTKDWVEQPMYDFPLHHFVDISDGDRGTAVFVQGIKEYEMIPENRIIPKSPNTLAITLFRAFTYTIQPSSLEDYSHQKGSQCLGEQRYRLAFYPHKGGWEEGNVYPEALNFNLDMALFLMGKNKGDLPCTTSFVKISPPNLAFSCFKKSDDEQKDGYILRIYNPTEHDIQGNIRFFFKPRHVESVTLEEKAIRDLSISESDSVNIVVERKKIATMRLRM